MRPLSTDDGLALFDAALPVGRPCYAATALDLGRAAAAAPNRRCCCVAWSRRPSAGAARGIPRTATSARSSRP